MEYPEETELDAINNRNTQEYIPAIVFVSIVIITGISVNVFATIFYACKAPKSVIQIFMFSLSLNDLVTNFVLLHDLVELFYFVQYKSVVACKLFYVLKHWLVGDSLLFMVAIAWDRYRRVCFPFSKEITLRVAWFIILGLMMFSICISVRSFATADILRINITTEHNITIQGYYCTLSEEQKLAVVRSVFHIVDICIHGVIICLLVFFYSFVVRKLIQSQKKLKSHDNLGIVAYKRKASQVVQSHTEGSSTDIVEINFSKSGNDHNSSTNKSAAACDNANNDIVQSAKQEIENKEAVVSTRGRLSHSIHAAIRKLPFSHSRDTDSDTDVSTEVDSKEHKTKTKQLSTIFKRNRPKNKKRGNATSRMEKRMTIMVAVITVASIACFVPYYVSMVVISPNLNGNGLVLDVGSIIVRRSFILNSAINPFIMVVFNAAFRHFLLDIFHRISSKCGVGKFKTFK
ncbi:D(2) dopamine receptor-like [Mercenaria mercenaria]|uniref:D(2) dopamine receptor-like n=1 Tax=Mercenaria mercenaria TaxID=6596 RepID=UPI00234F9142|nr:D(2) dopamine receptor-like [Mercenaria mercenaria]